MKNGLFKVLVLVVVVVCLSFVFVSVFVFNSVSDEDDVMLDVVYSEVDFPLEVDLVNTVFKAGSKISGTATITNKCGKDVPVLSNGQQPSVFLRNINDYTTNYAETANPVEQIFTVDEEMTTIFSYEHVASGTYELNVQYWLMVNGQIVQSKQIITIEVK